MCNENKDYLNLVGIVQLDISCTVKKTSFSIVEVIKHTNAQMDENVTQTIITCDAHNAYMH